MTFRAAAFPLLAAAALALAGCDTADDRADTTVVADPVPVPAPIPVPVPVPVAGDTLGTDTMRTDTATPRP